MSRPNTHPSPVLSVDVPAGLQIGLEWWAHLLAVEPHELAVACVRGGLRQIVRAARDYGLDGPEVTP